LIGRLKEAENIFRIFMAPPGSVQAQRCFLELTDALTNPWRKAGYSLQGDQTLFFAA
jgi:hypothetical protein